MNVEQIWNYVLNLCNGKFTKMGNMQEYMNLTTLEYKTL
jgi:hypothetical protein